MAKINFLLLMASLMFSTSGIAQQHHGQKPWPGFVLLAEQDLISKEQAIAIAKSRHKGKVLSADLEQGDGAPAYRIKLITDNGRVKTVRIHAREKSRGKN